MTNLATKTQGFLCDIHFRISLFVWLLRYRQSISVNKARNLSWRNSVIKWIFWFLMISCELNICFVCLCLLCTPLVCLCLLCTVPRNPTTVQLPPINNKVAGTKTARLLELWTSIGLCGKQQLAVVPGELGSSLSSLASSSLSSSQSSSLLPSASSPWLFQGRGRQNSAQHKFYANLKCFHHTAPF